MNELISTQNNEHGDIIVSGRELHEFLEVETPFRKWFPRMTEFGFVEGADYTPDIFVHPLNKQETTDFLLKLDMAKEIAMIQRTEKGKEARQYFLQVEKAWNSPEMIIKRAMQIQDKKILELQNQIQEDKRYTDFGKVVEMSEASVNIGAFVKIIFDKHGINIGRNKLFDWLRDKGYLIKSGREKNNPKQQYIEQGLFELRPTIVKRSEGDVQSHTTLITGKGQIKLAEILLNEFSNRGDLIG
ncbi:MAG: antA/AntB antirepressor family protein [Psychrobacillus psychrotolerans]|uniref:antA/AntB antirepressor family protein n=1 Tax=Psychrobacillus psychrotolerans TaxID=126156 RepID=UPI003BB1116C